MMSAKAIVLKDGERIEDLQLAGLRFIRVPGDLGTTTDAVLLADFACQKTASQVCELGAGTGTLALLLAGRMAQAHIDLIEIDPIKADVAARAIILNALSERMRIVIGDLRTSDMPLPQGAYDVVVANPPYHRPQPARQPGAQNQATHQVSCTFADVAHSAAGLLRYGGRLVISFPPRLLTDVVMALRANRLEPKRLRLVASFAQRAPYLGLLEAVHGGKPGMAVEPIFFLYQTPGAMTAAARRAYHQDDLSERPKQA